MKRILYISLLLMAQTASLECSEQKKTAESQEKKIRFEELDPNAKQYDSLQKIGHYLIPDLWIEVCAYVGPHMIPLKTLVSPPIKEQRVTFDTTVYRQPTLLSFNNNQLQLQFDQSAHMTWDIQTGKCTQKEGTTRLISRPNYGAWTPEQMNMKAQSTDKMLTATIDANPDKKTNRNQSVGKIHIILTVNQTKLLQAILINGYNNGKPEQVTDTTSKSRCTIS